MRIIGALRSLLLVVLLLATPAAAQQNAQGITGTWRGAMAMPWGQMMAVEVIFLPNGTYTSAAAAGNLMTRHWGRYEVVQNWIHFYIQGAAPREFCGPQRCTPLAWPNSETWVLTAYDGRVMQTSNGRLERVQ